MRVAVDQSRISSALRPFALFLALGLVAGTVSGCGSAAIGSAGFSGGGVAATDDLTAGANGLKVVSELPAPSGASGDTQLISPSDVITVDVFRVDELDHTAQVDSAGNISLPLIGEMRAAGLSLLSLQSDIKRRYGAKYLQNPEVSVSMKESVGQRVTVDGEFAKAGIYPTTAGSTLLQMIAQAGNFNGIGDPSNVFIYRSFDGQQLVAKYDVTQIREGKRPDPRIFGGDVIVAFPSGMKVLGSTLKDALGLAGGVRGIL